MEEAQRYYEIPSSEDSYRVRVDTVSQNNLTKLRALSYGVAVKVIVSKGKVVKNTWYKSDWKKIDIKEIAVPCQIRSADSASKKNGLLLTIAFKRNGCFRNRYGRIITTRKISQN